MGGGFGECVNHFNIFSVQQNFFSPLRALSLTLPALGNDLLIYSSALGFLHNICCTKQSQCSVGLGVGEHEVINLHSFTNLTAMSLYILDIPFANIF